MGRQWTAEQRKAASERAKKAAANPEATLQAFQRRASDVGEQVQEEAHRGVAVLERGNAETWPGGARKVYIDGHLIPEGMYHTVVTQYPVGWNLGCAFAKIESSGKGYKKLADIGPTKRIYVCDMAARIDRVKRANQQARSRVVGVITTAGAQAGPDALSITRKANSEPTEMDAFLASRISSGQISTHEALAAAEQARGEHLSPTEEL